MRLSIYISILLMITACGGAKTVDLNDKEEIEKGVYLLLGEGGGFTGAYNEYFLYIDGRVEIWDEMEQESVFKGSIPKKEAAAIFEKWEELSAKEVPNSRPGNMNYRIGYYENGTVKTLRWSDNQVVDDELLEFYRRTFEALKNAK